MAKIDSKFQESFYSKFIKFTIISCVVVTVLLFPIMVFFNFLTTQLIKYFSF